MFAEWLLIGLLLGTVLYLSRKRCGSSVVFAFVLAGVAATTAGAMLWQGYLRHSAEALSNVQQKAPRLGRPEEYAGSESCRSCHPSQYESWHRSYHRTMTQAATPEAVRGNFENVNLEFGGEKFHLERRGDEFWVNMIDPDWTFLRAIEEYNFKAGKRTKPPLREANPPRVDKRILMLTGSHHMQAYWIPGKYGNQQFNFPFTYLFEEARWVPRDDVFLRDPQTDHSYQTWNQNCITCHTTAPQGKQDPESYVYSTRVAEFGISCEACHGPALEHVRKNADPLRRYALHKAGKGDSTIVNPARLSSQKSAEVCSQCHAVRYNVRKDWL
ncbi:MAG: multiheme c-type cytochrome, partial [Bryobacteraceae bacterium]